MLTGRRTDSAVNMLEILKDASPDCIFHHMHQYFLRTDMQPQRFHNDFAVWVANALGDRVLSEMLANINPFAFDSIEDIRSELMDVITARVKEHGSPRNALPGNEFFFNESITLVLPSGYEANGIDEFYEALGKVDCSSIYFHFYEAKLRLGRDTDDFSLYLDESLGLTDLAHTISGFDPYMYDTESLREKLLNLIKKELK